MSKKNTAESRYPGIGNYLQDKYEDIYNILEKLDIVNSLVPRTELGLTFLMPDKKYIKEVLKNLDEEIETASDMMLSLMIPVCLKTPQDWKQHMGFISNLDGHMIKVTKVSGNVVEIDNAKLTVNTDYKPMLRQGQYRRDNTIIWNMDGSVKINGAEKVVFSEIKNHFKNHKDHAKPDVDGGNELQVDFSYIIKEELAQIASQLDKNKDLKSPMLEFVAKFYRGVNKSDTELKLKVRSFLTKHHIIDFFTIAFNPKLFDPEMVKNILAAGSNDVDTINNFYDEKISDLVVGNPEKLGKYLEYIKEELMTYGQNPNKLLDMYKSFYNGSLKYKVEDVYPESFRNIIKTAEQHLDLDIKRALIYYHSNAAYLSPNNSKLQAYTKMFDYCKTILCPFNFDKDEKNLLEGDFLEAFKLNFALYVPTSFKITDSRLVEGADEMDEIRGAFDVDFGEFLSNYKNGAMEMSRSTVDELRAFINGGGDIKSLIK